ncbi:uncharacterized protein (DUF1330 family) [Caulobacter ginsengisoli]|uniref:Uncharacterized protein (DUF1330 family) n=1 Tax=Caulobacter ginsengisoli TaxID=400775 RepID=A0ABU0IVQ0_9CAUL|nr:DUF1330 domain-containing protein [Caulobacter ginsengisoli]MDQ0466088.1 uncharacterized protein (DUF1330 family) [Caulobacter ginsengisoli]
MSAKPAYVVMIRERMTDPDEFEQYRQLAPKARGPHNIVPLAFYGAQQVLEGPPAEGTVVLKFDSVDAARAWYDSPAYQEALVHRLKGADYRVIIVEGV